MPLSKKSPKKKVPEISPQTVRRVYEALERAYPDPSTELTYESPFQLLIAVILSAQCTDERVNKTTPALFAKYPTAEKLALAPQAEVEKLIHSCGFYRAKARAIIKTSQDLVEKFGGTVPGELDALTTLAGVGRKTASVILNQAFDVPAIAVDTHVKRVAQRLGWAKTQTPEKIEFELRGLLPDSLWGKVNGMLILHGRRLCKARKPLCAECFLKKDCFFFATEVAPKV